MAEFAQFAGPGVVNFNSFNFFTDPGGISVRYERDVFLPATANWGTMGARHLGTRATISMTPAGWVTTTILPKYWPYTQADMGKLCRATLGQVLQICPYPDQASSQKITWQKGCITRLPSAKLSANSLFFSGPMEFTVFGDPSKSITDAEYWGAWSANTPPSPTVGDNEFPSAAVTVTYDGVTFEVDEDGVSVDFQLQTGNYLRTNTEGPSELSLTGLNLIVSFTPVAQAAALLEEQDYHTALLLDGTTAKVPGDFVGTTSKDLVVTFYGTSKKLSTLTFVNMGPGSGGLNFSSAAWRYGQIQFHNKPKITGGAPQPLFTST
jgi:hypothetical protein